ncbi:MAG: hypothetical protein ACREVS_23615 [Burkholderiales bacterium]
MALASGSPHEGAELAAGLRGLVGADRGGGIRDNHIDVLAGNSPENPFPSFVSSTPQRPFQAYVVADERVRPHLHRLHALD